MLEVTTVSCLIIKYTYTIAGVCLLFFVWTWSTVRVGIQPALTYPQFVTIGARDQDWKISERTGGLSTQGQLCQRCQESWSDGAGRLSTKPTQRGPRTTEFDRPVDIGLGATIGGVEEGVELRDSEVPRLPPEKQIQREEEVQTPPRRELRRNEGHKPRGPRITTDESGLGPVDLADQQRDTAGRNRPNNEWSPVAELEDSVSYAARSRGVTDGKPISEDAEGTSARAPGVPGGTYDDKGALV